MLSETATTMIAHSLSDVEKQQRAQELVAQLQALDSVAERKKMASREFKDEEDSIKEKIQALRVAVLTGVENFETPCEKIYDFDNRRVYWQTEDGRRHNEREMRDDELGKATRRLDVYMADEDEQAL